MNASKSFSNMSSANKTARNANAAFDGPDYMKLDPTETFSSKMTSSHAVFGPLMESNLIERFNVYKRINTSFTAMPREEQQQFNGHEEVMVVNFKIGTRLNSHVGIVHEGIISLLFDTSLGYGCVALLKGYQKDSIGLTANYLKVDFRAPFRENSEADIRVYLDKVEGRKLFFSGVLEDTDGSVKYAEAASLFIKIDPTKVGANEK